MRRRGLLSVAGSAFAGLAAARAQARRARVGYLSGGSALSAAPLVAALRASLAERGHVEPGSLELLQRYSEGLLERMAQHARELVAANVDVLVTSGVRGALAAREVTQTVPIVIAGGLEIVGAGLAASLARPGGNVTGLSLQRIDTAPKEVELLAELVPGLSRLSVLVVRPGIVGAQVIEAISAAASLRGITMRVHDIAGANEIEFAFAAMAETRSEAVIVVDAPLLTTHLPRIVAGALAARIAVLASSREYAEVGALASYGASLPAIYRRAAYFVDRILRGTAPGELPIEQPTVFELVINQRTARAIGLAIPQALLLRADEVIE